MALVGGKIQIRTIYHLPLIYSKRSIKEKKVYLFLHKYTFFGRLCKYLLLLSSILLYPK